MIDLTRQKQLLLHWLGKLSLFMIVVTIIQKILVQPLISLIIILVLQTTGYQVLFNTNMVEIFMTPQAITATVAVVVLTSLVTYFEFSVIILLVQYLKSGKKISLAAAVKKSLPTFSSLRGLGIIGYFIYVLIFLPVSGMGISSSIFPHFKIPNFITGELTKNDWGSSLLLVIYGLIAILFFLFIYTIPIMVLERKRFFASFTGSISYVIKHIGKIYKIFLLYLLIWLGIDWLPREFFFKLLQSFSINLEVIFQASRSLELTFCAILFLLIYYLGKVILMPALLSLIVLFYIPETQEIIDPLAEEKVVKRLTKLKKRMTSWLAKYGKNKRLWGILVLILFVPLSLSVWRIFERGHDLHEPVVIGHRGSAAGVENSLQAIQGAIDVKADYAEIDILLSADGIPMVIHDDSLKRLADRNQAVHDLTAEELRKITLKQNGFLGEIPTLEEVILLTKGKIDLAVELKRHQHEQKNLVDEVAKVLQAHGVLESSIILSLDYDLVAEMNTKYPETISGYCIFGGMGYIDPNVVRTMEIDFVFIEEWMATSENLMAFRRSWLPVYVWTVNQKESMQELLDMGVLGIVTDHPDWAVDAVNIFQQDNRRKYYPEDWKLEAR